MAEQSGVRRTGIICRVNEVKTFAQAERSRWSIENNLHWCPDVVFKDNECPGLDRNAAENLAIIRRIIYNKIKMLSDKDTLRMHKRCRSRTSPVLTQRAAPAIICR